MSSSSAGSDANGNATTVGDDSSSQASVVGDSCVWTTAAQECTAPRSCFDCLNVDVADDKCAIDSRGVCMSLYDLTLAEVSTDSYYASDEFAYCEAGDADCSACRSAWAEEYRVSGQLSSDPVCATSSGCVCLWLCSESTRHESIVRSYCSVLGSGQLLTFSGLALGMFLFFVVLALILRVWLRKYLARQDAELSNLRRRRRQPRREPKGPLLQLSGWNSMLDKLIESEQAAADEARPRLERAPSAPAAAASVAAPSSPASPASPASLASPRCHIQSEEEMASQV